MSEDAGIEPRFRFRYILNCYRGVLFLSMFAKLKVNNEIISISLFVGSSGFESNHLSKIQNGDINKGVANTL